MSSRLRSLQLMGFRSAGKQNSFFSIFCAITAFLLPRQCEAYTNAALLLIFPHCAGFQELLVEKELADSRNNSNPPLETFALKKEVKLRFLHFQLLDFWGKGGGLQYFSVEYGERISGAEPPIKVQVFENQRNTSWTPTVPIWASTRATWRDANRSATKCLTVLPSIGETRLPHQVDHILLLQSIPELHRSGLPGI